MPLELNNSVESFNLERVSFICKGKYYFEVILSKNFSHVKAFFGKRGNTILVLEQVEDWGEFDERGCCSLTRAVSFIEDL